MTCIWVKQRNLCVIKLRTTVYSTQQYFRGGNWQKFRVEISKGTLLDFTNFTFSISCTIIHLLQFKPVNAHIFITITIILRDCNSLHVSGLIVPSSRSTLNCTKQLLNVLLMRLFHTTCSSWCCIMLLWFCYHCVHLLVWILINDFTN